MIVRFLHDVATKLRRSAHGRCDAAPRTERRDGSITSYRTTSASAAYITMPFVLCLTTSGTIKRQEQKMAYGIVIILLLSNKRRCILVELIHGSLCTSISPPLHYLPLHLPRLDRRFWTTVQLHLRYLAVNFRWMSLWARTRRGNHRHLQSGCLAGLGLPSSSVC